MAEIQARGGLPQMAGASPRAPETRSIVEGDGPEDYVFRKVVTPIERVPVQQFNVPPWHATGLLNLAMNGITVLLGSGFMCAPDVFVTARHNLISKAFDAAGVWIAYDFQKHQTPQIAIRARAWHPSLDLAVLILAAPQANVLSLGGTAASDVALSGYGTPYPNGTMCMRTAQGPMTGTDGTSLGYSINTAEGDSGAPVTLANAVNRAIAVHTTAQGALPNSNFGTLISPQAINEISKLIASARSQIHG